MIPKIKGIQIPKTCLCASIETFNFWSIFVDFSGNRKAISTGKITEKQKIIVTSKTSKIL